MAVPKKRTSKRRKGMRRANDYLTFSKRVTTCENCDSDVLLHHICENCGYYKGKKIITGKEDIVSSTYDGDESSVSDITLEKTSESPTDSSETES